LPNTNCSWLIQPAMPTGVAGAAIEISLTFINFDVEFYTDWIKARLLVERTRASVRNLRACGCATIGLDRRSVVATGQCAHTGVRRARGRDRVDRAALRSALLRRLGASRVLRSHAAAGLPRRLPDVRVADRPHGPPPPPPPPGPKPGAVAYLTLSSLPLPPPRLPPGALTVHRRSLACRLVAGACDGSPRHVCDGRRRPGARLCRAMGGLARDARAVVPPDRCVACAACVASAARFTTADGVTCVPVVFRR
jgi:hypothetical protein